MGKCFIATITLLSLCLLSCSQVNHTLKVNKKNKEVISDIYNSIFYITLPNKKVVATGFAINKTILLTANHFCTDADETKRVIAINVFEDVLFGKIVKQLQKLDLCFIEFKDVEFEPLKIANNAPLIGEPICALGAPKGVFPTKTCGFVTNFIAEYINVSILTHPGLSGAPILTENNEVVGILIRYASEAPWLATGILLVDLEEL